MHSIIIFLGMLILFLSGFVRYWIVQHSESRPLILHDNSFLYFILILAGIGLGGGFFFMINIGSWLRACTFVAVLLGADQVIKWCFFGLEVRRTRRRLGCTHTVAIQTVRRRACSLTPHFD